MASRFRAVGVGGCLLWASACVSDPKVEDESPPSVGARQPEGSGETIPAADACQLLVDAEKAARDDLGCDLPAGLECPGYTRVAGATPCGEFYKDAVDACVEAIGAYRRCSEFSTAPCIATVVKDSCVPPAPPEAGTGDGGAGEGGDGGDGGSPEAGEGGKPDASSEGGSEGGVPDASGDASPEASVEAGAEASVEAGPKEAGTAAD